MQVAEECPFDHHDKLESCRARDVKIELFLGGNPRFYHFSLILALYFLLDLVFLLFFFLGLDDSIGDNVLFKLGG